MSVRPMLVGFSTASPLTNVVAHATDTRDRTVHVACRLAVQKFSSSQVHLRKTTRMISPGRLDLRTGDPTRSGGNGPALSA